VSYQWKKYCRIIPNEEIQRRLHKARHDGKISGITFDDRVKAGVAANILTAAEAKQLLAAHATREEIYAVDDFAFEDLARVMPKKRNQAKE
jgi:hypothetical protein